MTIEFIEGNLVNAFGRGDVDVLVHCCNAQGVMGSGLAKTIKENYPAVFQRYRDLYLRKELALGSVVGVRAGEGIIYNIIGQKFYGTDGRYVNYGALGKCLQTVAELTPDLVVGFPYKLASDRGGASWIIVREMIQFYFKDHQIKIYKL